MESVTSFLCNNFACLSLTVGVLGVSIFFVRRYFTRTAKPRVCGVDYPKDTVVVHQFSKGDFIPSTGHFVMKLETYLRINNIPYKPAYGMGMGPKRKVPWIEYNGVTMGDSQLIMEFLNEEFKVDLNQFLDNEQRAVAWAIQKWVEEFIYHLNVYTRWYLLSDDLGAVMPSLSRVFRYTAKKVIGIVQWIVGTARHSKREVHDMMVFNLRHLSAIIGDKKFVMGGDGPTDVDCAVFGILAQVMWCTPDTCPGKQLLKGELHNLVAFLERIKELYWPDWDDRITRGRVDR